MNNLKVKKTVDNTVVVANAVALGTMVLDNLFTEIGSYSKMNDASIAVALATIISDKLGERYDKV